MLTIGDKQFATRHPADLDAELVASTGCTAAEHARFAVRGTPSQLAHAAMPLLSDPPRGGSGELAEMIADADLVEVRRQVVALLTDSAEPAPAAAPGKSA